MPVWAGWDGMGWVVANDTPLCHLTRCSDVRGLPPQGYRIGGT